MASAVAEDLSSGNKQPPGSAPGRAEATTSEAKIDAGRLKTGRFVYRILEDGEEVAGLTSTIEKRADGSYRFTGAATGAFSQEWESIAISSLEPISAALRIGETKGKTQSMSLKYKGGRVTGVNTTKAEAKDDQRTQSPPVEKVIDAPVPAGTVDQRIDWAGVLEAG